MCSMSAGQKPGFADITTSGVVTDTARPNASVPEYVDCAAWPVGPEHHCSPNVRDPPAVT